MHWAGNSIELRFSVTTVVRVLAARDCFETALGGQAGNVSENQPDGLGP
jgi:hypothetical protein